MRHALLSLLALSCATTPASPPPAPAPDAGVVTTTQAPRPPVAKKVAETSQLHGLTRVDDYAWMKKKGTKELEDYLAAENAYADWWMERTASLRETLYKETLARVQETDTDAPYPLRGYEYYSRTEAGKQYAIECRRKLPAGKEEVLLDLNELGKDQQFVAVEGMEVSDDNQLLAYTTDFVGFREFTLHVKNLATGALLPDTAAKVRSVAWAADNTLFYTTENDAKRSSKLFRHTLGTPTDKDTLVYEEKDERFNVYVGRTRSAAYVLVILNSRTTNEIRFIDAKAPRGEPKLILPRRQDVEYSADHRGDSFFIVTNDKGRTQRLVQVPVKNPEKGKWVELIPTRPDVMLNGVDVFDDFYVVSERANGLARLRAFDFKTKKETTFDMPEEDYFLLPAMNAEPKTSEYRFAYGSMVTPLSILARDLKTGATRTLKVQPVPTYDASKYVMKRMFATARDGTKIPVSVAMKKGTPQDGSAPMYLRAYGSYGMAMEAWFSISNISLLDRGVIVALPHIRGGGEYGKPWHDAGRMMNKRNTFTDFIDVADFFVKEKWTSSDRLAINGGSAGGLLMGAVLNMRPELFKAALVEVPFVDVVNTMLDESLPLTVEEFEEWGNPKVKAEYDYLMTYSPYDNVSAQAYPAMLVRSSYNDSQVLFHEPTKWVAKLRALKQGSAPLLLRMVMDPAGHGGRSGRYDRLEDGAYYQAFVLWQLGITR